MVQGPEETLFAGRIAATIAPLHLARHNRARLPVLHDADGRRSESHSLEESMRAGDLSELIGESTG
jgi:hypothetical protein